MDCGCTVQGYQSDISRTFVHGTATPEQRRVWDQVARGQQIAFAAAKLGAAAGSVDDAVRGRCAEKLKEAGDAVGHAWLLPHERADGAARILVFARDKPLFFNYRAGAGYSIEPKSLLLTKPAEPA